MSKGWSAPSQFAAGPSRAPRARPSWPSISWPAKTRSAGTSQSNTTSPAPVSASARRSVSDTRAWLRPPPAKACCITVKPISITISTRPPISAGCTRSLPIWPVTAKPAAVTQTTSSSQVGTSRIARS